MSESLVNIPGLFFQNQYNFAQDLRISIRGFGARTPFGIRGIKIYSDGIPKTLPDGQSNVDSIDLGSIRRIEVIRGPISSVYGAAAGGVINITTEEGPEIPFVSGRFNVGSYGYAQGQVKAGGQIVDLNYLVNGSTAKLDGYRDHSTYRSWLLNSKFRYAFDATSDLTMVLNAVDAPEAQDPGALTASEVQEDRRQAAPRNLLFDAGEKLDQQTIGLVFNKEFDATHAFMLRNYYVWRDFENKLPFDVDSNGQGGSVKLARFFTGGGGNYTTSEDLLGRGNRLMLGFGINAQRDHRKRFVNNQGILGVKTTDQDEDVTNYAVYFQDVLEIVRNVTLTLGVRYDMVKYDVNDHTGGNGSGSISFDEINPQVGILWGVLPAVNLYGNIARSFDPPTTTELANPTGASGFNKNLKAQKAINYEIGVKGLLPGQVRYEIALFHIDVRDELVPFELSGSGQTFFENAGSSTHDGLEAALTVELLSGLTGTLTYTHSDFTFDTFQDRNGNNFDGNNLPGIPDNVFHIELFYVHPTNFYVGWDLLYADSLFGNNANTVKTEAYRVGNLRAGYNHKWKKWEIAPFIGIKNMFDEEYNDNIRLNASFGRFFEPAPERNFYGGIGIWYQFE
jgi:iron complex outermembrane receptor protein